MDDLIRDFLVETNEGLEQLDQDLLLLEQFPEDAEVIGKVFRIMHTIKGTCGFLGMVKLQALTHEAENVMDKVRGGQVKATAPVVSLILETTDAIKAMVAHIELSGGTEPARDDSNLISRLRACATGNVSVVPAAPVSKTPDLDFEIDFTPVMADGSALPEIVPEPPESEEDKEAITKMMEEALKQADENMATEARKTPDLDFDIDFTPVKAGDVPEVKAALPAVPAPAPADTKTAQSKALADGLKMSIEAAKQQAPSQGVTTQGLRVGIEVLERLMDLVSELVLTRNQLMQILRKKSDNDFAAPLQILSHITSDLQEGVMRTRMQPIGNAWTKFPRLVRELSSDLGKNIELKMEGSETELDRQLLDMVRDPLTHMLRNAADHGLETPEERRQAGKPEVGMIQLSAFHEEGHIVIRLSDDGRGLNPNRIREKAVEKGLATEAELDTMDNKQVYQYIFRPGFSTAEKITAVSGRGVGMDVVSTNISKMGGTLELDSQPGRGSQFTIRIPLTLAIISALVVETNGQRFGIPQVRVGEIVRARMAGDTRKVRGTVEYVIETINDATVMRLRDRLISIIPLCDVLKLPEREVTPVVRYVVVCEVGSDSFGIMIDRVYDTEEIVVKPVAGVLQSLDIYSGATILGDGSVIFIVDPNSVYRVFGGNAVGQEQRSHIEDKRAKKDERASFLIFKAWGNSPKAVPLELVSRLEEIDSGALEWSGKQRVVQYRDTLMRLVSADLERPLPEGMMEVVVFADGDKVLGLVVEEVLDIVEQHVEIVPPPSGSKGIVGSMVLREEVTDLIDIGSYFTACFEDWLRKDQATEHIAKRVMQVLLVDDSPFFRKFIKPILTVAGYNVTTAESARDALKMFDKGLQVDVVITDIDMPGMNGVDFVRVCKQRADCMHIPFIALTSISSGDVVENTTALGFAGYVSKSDRERLVGAIAEALNTLPNELQMG